MGTENSRAFAHGTYGDISGVTFYGPPVEGFWEDRVEVSDRFIGPLFGAISERAQREEPMLVPALVAAWIDLSGWTDANGRVELQPEEVADFTHRLEAVTVADLARHVRSSAVTCEECLQCAEGIIEFLRERVRRADRVYIERD